MDDRPFTALGRQIRVVGTGTWQLGVDQGEVGLDEAAGTLSCACQTGVNLVETADVYGDGRSERFVGRFLAEHPEAGLAVVTKTGRRLPPDSRVLQPRQSPVLERSLPGEPRR